MLVLGIETSCDETSVAIVEDGTVVRSNVIATSKQSFEKLAGVIPEQAARRQLECMIPVLDEALKAASSGLSEIDAIAVTKGPGLLGSLLVGTTTARTIALRWGKPIIGVHHTLGHLSSTWIYPSTFKAAVPSTPPEFPILTLSASGGHTDLWYRTTHMKGVLLGRTRDDAAGEAFDKGASQLGLPYPGGPSIAKLAREGDPQAYVFPLPLRGEKTLDFSFSGLKTSLKYLLRELKSDVPAADVAASFQHAICMHLIDRIAHALEGHPDVREVHIVGGVSANTYLRDLLANAVSEHRPGCTLRWPNALEYCTDNAAMIAAAGFFMIRELDTDATRPFSTDASIPLELAVA